jgi:MFS family permease
VAPWAPDRFGGRRLGAAALVAIMAGLAVMGLVVSPVGLYIGTAVMALGVAFLPPAILTMAQVGVPDLERGVLFGTTSAFIEVGFGVGPVMLGVVAASSGYPITFLVSAAIGALGLLLLGLSARQARSPSARKASTIAS